MTKFLISLIILLTTAATALPQAVVWEAPVFDDSETRYANDLIRKGRFDEAISFLLEVYQVRKHTNHKRTVDLLVEAFKNSKQYDMLKDFAEEYHNDFPDSLEGYLVKAKSYFLTDNDDQAREVLTDALEKLPDDKTKYIHIAREYMTNGIMQEAIDVYKEGRNRLGDPFEFSREIAGLYEALGRYSEAASEYLLQSINNRGFTSFAISRIKVLFDNADEPEDILKALEKVAKKYPDDTEKLRVLSEACREAGRFDESLDYFIAYDQATEKQGHQLLSFLTDCLADRQYDLALKGSEYITGKYEPSDVIYWRGQFVAAGALEGKGDLDKARDIYNMIIESSRDRNAVINSYMRLGDVSFREGEFTDAETHYNMVIQKFPNSPEANGAKTRLGDIQLYNADFDSALAIYEAIVFAGEKSGEDEVKFKIAKAYLYDGDIRKSTNELKKYMFDFPSGDYANECLVLIDIVNQAFGDSAGVLILGQADYRIHIGRFEQADSILSHVIDSVSTPAIREAAYLNKITIQEKLGRPKRAIELSEEFEKRFPDSYFVPFVLLKAADIYRKDLNKDEKAQEIYSDILNRFPESMIVDKARENLRLVNPGDQS
ncbi:MAG: tetratricopeptide repeat protein [candidate division Zixibacteria bacterium]|nr:tetratricopeptide repeat protein [candidate division Zixibacteria bacterium]